MIAPEILPVPLHTPPGPWKILVVDDDDEVRILTRMTLQGFSFRGRAVELLEASSAAEAQSVLRETQDVAVAIIDVVMETDHAGLDLVRWIRKEHGDELIRLVIRTGQAGLHPPSEVTGEYEINDYWEKTELTFSRFQTSLTTSLRGYEDVVSLHRRSIQVRHWADKFPEFLGVRDWNTLLRLVLLRLTELFPRTQVSAFACRNDGARWPLIAGLGRYPAGGGPDVIPYLDEALASQLLDAWNRRDLVESTGAQVLYFEVSTGQGHLFVLELAPEWGPYERNVARLVLQNFRAILENRTLITDLEAQKAEAALLLHRQEDVNHDLHHRFQTSLQVLLSFAGIEAGGASAVPPGGTLRRLQALVLLHSLLRGQGRLSGLDFQTFLQGLVAQGPDPSHLDDLGLEYWGVPVEVSLTQAVPLVLATVEMIRLARSPDLRETPPRPVQLVLSARPRCLTVGRLRPGPAAAATLSWELIGALVSQLKGRATLDEGTMKVYWGEEDVVKG